MKKTKISIKGMHCRSCEILIEDKLKAVKGVAAAAVDHQKGLAVISHSDDVKLADFQEAVKSAGYQIGEDSVSDQRLANGEKANDFLLALLLFLGLFLVVLKTGLFNFSFKSSLGGSGLVVAFLIGITAGLSTCMALVGGLVLGLASHFVKKNPQATPAEKFIPHLYFNLGRVIGFFFLGGSIGFLGSMWQFSGTVLGLLTVGVGLVMLLLGIQLAGIWPKLEAITLPKGLSRWLGISERKDQPYSNLNSFSLGILTFFLPCGFTQAMQLAAVSSGSFLKGGLTMAVFALGTTPGLLGVGGLTAIVQGRVKSIFFKLASLVIIAMALFNLSNGLTLMGLNPLSSSKAGLQAGANIENGVQVIRMDQKTNGYSPNHFVIYKNLPVKWIINSLDPHSCASSILVNQLGIRKFLQAGENVIEFTPQTTGEIRFSCTMGMYSGSFTVIEKGQ